MSMTLGFNSLVRVIMTYIVTSNDCRHFYCIHIPILDMVGRGQAQTTSSGSYQNQERGQRRIIHTLIIRF